MIYSNAGLMSALSWMGAGDLGKLEEQYISSVLYTDEWWELLTQLIPPGEGDKDYMFTASEAVQPQDPPSV
jgi:hypothetical protein